MLTKDAKREFERFLANKKLSLSKMTPQDVFAALVDFYRDVRATDCEHRSEADMLLVQWGVYDWGKGEHFSFNVTASLFWSVGRTRTYFKSE